MSNGHNGRMMSHAPHVIFRFAKPKHLGDCFAGGGCYETSSPALGIWLLLWGLTWGWVKTYNFPIFSISWGMGWKNLYLTPYLGMNIHKSQLFPSYFDILQDTWLSMHSQMDEIPSSWGPLQPGWCLVDAGGSFAVLSCVWCTACQICQGSICLYAATIVIMGSSSTKCLQLVGACDVSDQCVAQLQGDGEPQSCKRTFLEWKLIRHRLATILQIWFEIDTTFQEGIMFYLFLISWMDGLQAWQNVFTKLRHRERKMFSLVKVTSPMKSLWIMHHMSRTTMWFWWTHFLESWRDTHIVPLYFFWVAILGRWYAGRSDMKWLHRQNNLRAHQGFFCRTLRPEPWQLDHKGRATQKLQFCIFFGGGSWR